MIKHCNVEICLSIPYKQRDVSEEAEDGLSKSAFHLSFVTSEEEKISRIKTIDFTKSLFLYEYKSLKKVITSKLK